MSAYKIANSHLTVTVNSFGAELSSVVNHNNGIEYIWQADSNVWARHAPILFPIVGKLKNGQYNFQDKHFSLSQHGFARDKQFTCISETHNELVFELTESFETLEVFPFKFRLNIVYTLVDFKLHTKYLVHNLNNDDMYFSIGAHPAFNCPLQLNETFEDYELYFKNNTSLNINLLKDGIISHETKKIELLEQQLPISTSLFNNDALVCMNTQIEEVTLQSNKTKHGVTLTAKKWPYFGIWTKKASNQFICLEPWFGIADLENATGNITQKEGIIKLEGKEQFSCVFDILFF